MFCDMDDESAERLPIGNNEFKDWLKNLGIPDRLRIMTDISKGLAKRGVPSFKIGEALVQFSQRCSVEVFRLSKETIKRYTTLRRRKLKSPQSKSKHATKNHLSALTNCANTSGNKKKSTNKQNHKQLGDINKEQNADSKKRKRIKERYRELFGDDYESNDLESNPVKKVKGDMVCESSVVSKSSDTRKSPIVQTSKVQRTESHSSDDEWNKMGLPSPSQRSKCILNENMMENCLFSNQEIPQETPQEEHAKPKIGSIRVRSLSELTNKGFQEKAQVDPKEDRMPLVYSIQGETLLDDPKEYETPLADSKYETPPDDPKQNETPLVYSIEDETPREDPKEDETPLDDPNQNETPLSNPKDDNTPLVDPKNDERQEVDPKEAEKCFWIVYNLNFNEQLEGNIKKLGELLWLAGTYYIQKIDRIERAKQLSSYDLAMEEKQRAELHFSTLIEYRGNDFAPLFLELFNKFEDSGNAGNKRTLFIMLFCRILHHAQSFNSDSKSYWDSSYIELAREVTSLMISNYQPGYDIFNDLNIDSKLFVNCLKKSYQLIFSLDESQTVSSDVQSQPEQVASTLSPVASPLPATSDQPKNQSNVILNTLSETKIPRLSPSLMDAQTILLSQSKELPCLPTLPGPTRSVNYNQTVATNQETESLAKISNIQESPNLQLIKELNRPTLSEPQRMVNVNDTTMNQDVRPTVISKAISKTPLHCSNQSQPRFDHSQPQSVAFNRLTYLNEALNLIRSVQITQAPNPSSNVVNTKDNESAVISARPNTSIAQQTVYNSALCPNNQTLLQNPNALNRDPISSNISHLIQKPPPYLPNQHQSNHNAPKDVQNIPISTQATCFTQQIISNPLNNQLPYTNSKPHVQIPQTSSQIWQANAVASKAIPPHKPSYPYKRLSEQTNRQVTQAVDQFLASKLHSSSQSQARPMCNSTSLDNRVQNPPHLTKNLQATRFYNQSRPPFPPNQPPPVYGPNINVGQTNHQLTTVSHQSFVSNTNTCPPIQPRPFNNPNYANQNVQNTSQHTLQDSTASLQTLSGQSMYRTNHYALPYTPNVNTQSARICYQSPEQYNIPRNLSSHSQYQPRPIYNPASYIQRTQNNVASVPALPESRTTPLTSQYQRQSSCAANSQCIQGIPQTRRIQPTLTRHVVSQPGSNAANLHHIQPLPQNVNGPNNSHKL